MYIHFGGDLVVLEPPGVGRRIELEILRMIHWESSGLDGGLGGIGRTNDQNVRHIDCSQFPDFIFMFVCFTLFRFLFVFLDLADSPSPIAESLGIGPELIPPAVL